MDFIDDDACLLFTSSSPQKTNRYTHIFRVKTYYDGHGFPAEYFLEFNGQTLVKPYKSIQTAFIYCIRLHYIAYTQCLIY